MELQLSGLMESGKAPAVGMLIGAKYLAFGEITSEPDGYRFQFRLVELETGKIVYEEGATFAIGGAKELVQIYAPPGYRFIFGGVIGGWDFYEEFSLGPDIGFGWFLTADDELLFAASFGYGLDPYPLANETIHQPSGDSYKREAELYLTSCVDGRLGYGRCFRPTPFLLLRPQISLGAVYCHGFTHYRVIHFDSGGSPIEDIDDRFNSTYFAPYVEAGLAMVLSNDSPLGVYVELGCDRLLPSLSVSQVSPFGLAPFTASIGWRARLSAGIQFHL